MLDKCVNLFNEYHGTTASVMKLDQHHYTFVCQGEMRGFAHESDLIHFLMCGTTHLAHSTQAGQHFTAYNLAMMYANRRCGERAQLVYSVATNGKTTLWGLNGSGWFKVAEYSNIAVMYQAVLATGLPKIRAAVKGQTSFLSTIKRLLGR